MKLKNYFLATLVAVTTSLTFTACNDDDDTNENSIVGEWIGNDDRVIYYNFKSDGTGRYICLADEPGFDKNNPQPAIENPIDPYDFDYTFDGNILTTSEEYYNSYGIKNYSEDEYEVQLTSKNMKIKLIRWRSGEDKDSEWVYADHESDPANGWELYNRYR